jgi:hypothetical protein
VIVRDVLVAQGEPAVNEVPSYLQLNPLLEVKSTPPLKDTDSVDHRTRSPFTIIKKDMALAKQKRHRPGREGTNVYGESIGYNVNHPEAILAWGENTRMEDRYLLSNINGQLVIKNKVVSVRETLVIHGAVGYSTGNIIFPGNVEIHGAVSDGFKIYSGGNVTIKQTFDVTDAVTKGDLIVAGGIIGRGRALVKVGGTLTTKFIENCSAACRKIINVDVEILRWIRSGKKTTPVLESCRASWNILLTLWPTPRLTMKSGRKWKPCAKGLKTRSGKLKPKYRIF